MKTIIEELRKEALKNEGIIYLKTKLEIKKFGLSKFQLLEVSNTIEKDLLKTKKIKEYSNFIESFTLFVSDNGDLVSIFSKEFDEMIFNLLQEYVSLSTNLLVQTIKVLKLMGDESETKYNFSDVISNMKADQEYGEITIEQKNYFYAFHGLHLHFRNTDPLNYFENGMQIEAALEDVRKIDIYFLLKYITTYKKYEQLSKLFKGENPLKINELFNYYQNCAYLEKMNAYEYMVYAI